MMTFHQRKRGCPMSRKKMMAQEGMLPFTIDEQPLRERLTARAGLPLMVEMFRSLGLSAVVGSEIRLKERNRGFTEAEMVEEHMVLLAAGGECLDDFSLLAGDEGLDVLLGRKRPSPEAARDFLYKFHDEKMEEKRPSGQKAWIPPETSPLIGLGKVNQEMIRRFGERVPTQKIATVDQDATVIESRKREALFVYEGGRGYQPQIAIWAETLLVLADEFRDGNVPAGMAVLPLAKRAFAALPATVVEFNYRGDSASYNHDLMNWLRDEDRPDGPRGFIRFAISADMSEELRKRIAALTESDWQTLRRPGGQADPVEANEERHWAEVEFIPSAGPAKKDVKPDRYLAIRIRDRQQDLLDQKVRVRHLAIVTNEWEWAGDKVIWWQRAKAGTVEMVHDILKNEVGAGVLPCGRYGANAAWFRLCVLTWNLMVALKWIALPPEFLDARPKRLRFAFFTLAARVTSSGRQTLLRIAATIERIAAFIEARTAIWVPTPCPSS